MKRHTPSIFICSCYLTLLILTPLSAQVQLTIQPGSSIRLEGNSTIHEYSATTSKLSGSVVVDSFLFVEGKMSGSQIVQFVEINIPVRSLLSGNESLDDNLYDALNADDFPDIIYRSTGDTLLSQPKRDSLVLRTTGKLAVAGKENIIEMNGTLTIHPNRTISVKGSKELMMTDFGIEPPSMMLGVLKTDDKVVIRFELILQSQQHVPQESKKGQ